MDLNRTSKELCRDKLQRIGIKLMEKILPDIAKGIIKKTLQDKAINF